MIQPLVSVVIPFYSGKRWLIDALESVINQTYKNIEIIIINDGSKEDISDLEKLYNNRSVQFIKKDNGGPASARNLGIEKSSGKYIAFLDSDDIWLEKKLEKQIDYMEKNKSIWSHHSYEMFWENNGKVKVVDTSNLKGDIYLDCFISFKVQTSCVIVNREVIIENNILFPIQKRHGQDSDFYRQMASKYSLDYIDGVYSKFRIRGSNAGFRAEVQLKDKALLWNEIREDADLMETLPKKVILGYRLADKNYSIFKRGTKSGVDQQIKELYAKVLYSIPYLLFKL